MFMGRDIKNFLGLSEKEIKIRKEELKSHLPSYPGVKYLENKLNEFKVQPWPFIEYLAYWAPEKLTSLLESYTDYDGGENSGLIMEKLREAYITFELLQEIQNKN